MPPRKKKLPVEEPKTQDFEAPKLPDSPTWTEEEIQGVANFVNYMWKFAKFSALGMKDMKAVQNMFVSMHQHVSKIEKYAFEIKKVAKK